MEQHEDRVPMLTAFVMLMGLVNAQKRLIRMEPVMDQPKAHVKILHKNVRHPEIVYNEKQIMNLTVLCNSLKI